MTDNVSIGDYVLTGGEASGACRDGHDLETGAGVLNNGMSAVKEIILG